MKALTLTQPWATAVARGVKCIETRSWGTSYRGWLAIHAAKGWTVDDREFALEDAYRFLELYPEQYPRSCIVAIAKLVKVVPAESVVAHPIEELFGNFGAGRFAWFLDEVTSIPEPVSCKGAQGLWRVPDDVLAECKRQVFGDVPAVAQ